MPKNMTNIDIREYEGGDFAKIEDNYTDRQVQVAIANRAEKLIERIKTLENNPDVVDIVATYADLQAYDTQHLTDKDIIRVLQDETHDGESTYYRYNKQSDTWTYIGESKQYRDFVGTDGTTAGEAGLVPAPATTDAGKFLKADGTWDDAAGSTYTAGDGIDITNDIISATNTGKARVLTTDDYNWPTTGTKTSVALWLLESGIYLIPYSGVSAKINTTTNWNAGYGGMVVIERTGSGVARSQMYFFGTGQANMYFASTDVGNGTKVKDVLMVLDDSMVVQSTGTSTSSVMSQKAVTDALAGIGGGVTELTTADYNYPTDNPDGVALWLLDEGEYAIQDGIKFYKSRTSSETGNGSGVVVFVKPSSTHNGTMILTRNNARPSTIYGIDTTGANGTNLEFPVTVSQSTGTSTSSVMSQKAVTDALAGIGGGITELTSADYNYPENNPAGVALWTLDNGTYYVADPSVGVFISTNKTASQGIYTVADYGTASKQITVNDLVDDIYGVYRMNKTTGVQGAYHPYSPTVVQTTGTSQADVMSQNAVTSMVFADPSTMYKIKIGAGASTSEGSNGVEIGHSSQATGLASVALGYQAVATKTNSVAIGQGANVGYANSVAIGKDATPTRAGEVNIGSGSSQNGFNNSEYRVLGGLYDGQDAHDAATKGQLDTAIINGGTTAPTTATVGAVGTLYTAVESGTAHLYACTAVDTTDPSNPVYTWSTLV